MIRAVVLAAALIGAHELPAAGQPAAGQPAAASDAPAPDYFAQHHDADTIKVRANRPRTGEQKLLIGGLAGGAALAAGIGIYFHLDSRRIANDLSADSPQVVRWSPERRDKYDRGQLDGKLAIASYVIAGALIGGTIVAVLMTDPGSDLIEVPTRRVTPTAGLVPGGGTVGAVWSW